MTTNTDSESPVIVATALHKRYGRGDAFVEAISGVDLTASSEEFIAVMGTSGSGKSTLLQLLGGLERADSGSIHFEGNDICRMSDSAIVSLRRQSMGVVFQAYNLMPTLDAVDNVALPLLLAGMGRRTAVPIARDCLNDVGMSHRMGSRPAQLSGGEQQRVALARALVNQPKLILADEPTGSLDRKNTHAVCELLCDVASTAGRSTVVVTHDPAVADYADRVLTLEDGQIAERMPVGQT
ncbi:ABC transporter ATP-binding protein [Roseiconus lacunae]|uniref:ABC transporter ATP-binding protein n=1 Tax=Roseiconus lacunae TaxID=2605694 RepID=UPI0011F26F8F|nr:ABC transporter ATP-binding protein [Roseiconus lacunae]